MDRINEKNNKKVLKNAAKYKIVIVGCGGLGSNISQMLIRSGIWKLTVVDFDSVCESNLNRQFFFTKDLFKSKVDALEENLRMISESISVKKIFEKINYDNFDEHISDFDILVEACDCVESKKMLLDCFLKLNNKKKYLVCGSGMAGIEDSNLIKTKCIGGNIFVCGDGVTGVTEERGILAPRVMLTAAHQANAVLRIIAGEII